MKKFKQPFKILQERKLLYYASNSRMMTEAEDVSEMMPSSAYIGVDPTSDSIHLGNYVSFLVLNHLRLAGY